MNILCLGGSGDMGQGVIEDLKKYTSHKIVIADYNIEKAKQVAQKFDIEAIFADANNHDELLEIIEDFDVIVNTVGPNYIFAPKVVRATIDAGVKSVDICDDYGPMDEIFEMNEDAVERETLHLVGMGWTPGISNVFAKKGCEELDEVETIGIYWAGSVADAPGFAVTKHLFYAITGEVPTYRGGEFVDIDARSGKEFVDFPEPLGEVQVFHCGHPEPLTIPRHLEAENVFVKGGLTPQSHNTFAEIAVRLGFTKDDESIDGLSRAVQNLEPLLGRGGTPCSGLRTEVIGEKNGKRMRYVYKTVGRMRHLTGYPASIGAKMILDGEVIGEGCLPPEACVKSDSFFEELEKREIPVYENSEQIK